MEHKLNPPMSTNKKNPCVVGGKEKLKAYHKKNVEAQGRKQLHSPLG